MVEESDDAVGARMEAIIEDYFFDPRAQITIENSPNGSKRMKALGRFKLRALANALGVLETDKDKVKFMQMSVEDQAEFVLMAKASWLAKRKPT